MLRWLQGEKVTGRLQKPDFHHLLSLLQLLPVGLPCAGITAAQPPLCSVILTVVTEGMPLSLLDTL